ncbi:MAG: tRNA (cytidine(34)-2'-O)-methyltransferase [Myxococcota bacterium]
MLHIILFQPDIPQNTGNIGRLCAVTRSRLHLIHPLGFDISDKHLRRSGMDYWRSLDVHEHASWADFLASDQCPSRIWLFSTKASTSLWDTCFADGDGLLFGKETAGSPQWLHTWAGERQVRVPQFDDNLRSLNLATCAGICTYEALRQIHSVRTG